MRASPLILASALSLVGLTSFGCDRIKAAVADDGAESDKPRPDRRSVPPKRPRAISLGCGFAVRLPFRRSTDPTPPQLLDQLGAEDRFRKVVVSASCADLPSVGSPATFFEISSHAMLDHVGATKTSEKRIELEGRSGVEIRASVPNSETNPAIPWSGEQDVRLRMYLSGKRVYQLMVLQAADNADADDVASDFLDSFEFRADAPPPSPAATWTRHVVGGFAVEAPGKPKARDRGLDHASHDIEFEHEDGTTGYAIRLWNDTMTARTSPARERLDTFFELVFRTEYSEVVSRKHVEHGQWPALDVSYHHNRPVPDSIVPSDPAARKAFEAALAHEKSGAHVRLVLVDDEIVELRARMSEREDRVQWFMESLALADAPTD